MEQHQTHQMGALIAKLRKERNMTQKELAAKLGVTDKAVSKWERSLSCPDIALLSVGWAWGIFWLLVKKAPRRRWRKLQMTAAVCLLTVPLSWAIRSVAAWMLREPVGAALADGAVNTLSAVLAAAGFFLWDMLAARRGERGRDRCTPCGRGAGDGEDA